MKHIVVLRLSAMGDVAMTIPVLRAWAKANPQVQFTLVTRPLFTQFINTELPNLSTLGVDLDQHKGIIGLAKLAREITHLNPTVLLDMHDVLRTKILRRLMWKTKTRVFHKGRTQKKQWITNPTKRHQLPHTTDRYSQILSKVNYLTPPQHSLHYYPAQQSTTPTIAIAPFAQHISKQYGLHQIEGVIAELSQSYTIQLYGGGKEQSEWCDTISKRYDNVESKVEVNFKEQLKAISQSAVMISMDSANAHIAALYNIPVVTLWGGTHPQLGFAAVSTKTSHILPPHQVQDQIQYTPYGKTQDPYTQRAIQQIKPIDIIDAVHHLMVSASENN